MNVPITEIEYVFPLQVKVGQNRYRNKVYYLVDFHGERIASTTTEDGAERFRSFAEQMNKIEKNSIGY